MSLTPSQVSTLADDINAKKGPGGDLEQQVANGDNVGIQTYYNTPPTTDFWVFRTSVTNTDFVDGDAVDFNEYKVLTQGERDSFAMLIRNGQIDPTPPHVRSAFTKIFPPAASNTRSGILAAVTRLAKRAEQLFAVATTGPASGNGSAPGASMALVFEGDITLDDVRAAMFIVRG